MECYCLKSVHKELHCSQTVKSSRRFPAKIQIVKPTNFIPGRGEEIEIHLSKSSARRYLEIPLRQFIQTAFFVSRNKKSISENMAF